MSNLSFVACPPLEASYVRTISEPPMGGVYYHPVRFCPTEGVAGTYEVRFEGGTAKGSREEIENFLGPNCWFKEGAQDDQGVWPPATSAGPPDPVNPSHYLAHAVTPIDLIEAYDLGFNLGNVIKYVARAEEKDGREDLLKGLWYLLNELRMPRPEIIKLTKSLKEKP